VQDCKNEQEADDQPYGSLFWVRYVRRTMYLTES
jgi:hypothetical protein